MKHITDMQYLREKVGLYGYAQIEPLMIYKTEAYSKFQTLLFAIKKETMSRLIKTDYSAAQQQAKVTVQAVQPTEINMVEMLKKVNSVVKAKQPIQNVASHDSWVEVIETDEPVERQLTDLSWTTDKLRPNDKLNVQDEQWKIHYGVKYKKVKDDLASWKLKRVA